MWLTLGETSVRDGELSLEEVTRRLDRGFSTSGPTPGEFAQAIEAADDGQGVVVVTLAHEMSSTHDSARLAASLYDDDKVRLLDTETAAGAEGLVALAAARAAAAGAGIDDVAAAATRAIDGVRLVATLPSLDHLARGGRVPGAAAWAGRAFGVNPLFEFRSGHAHPLRPAIGRAHAYERVVAQWSRTVQPEADLHAAVMHALDPVAAEQLLEAVRAKVRPATCFVGSFSPVMVAHTGPGLVGMAWWWDADAPDPTP
jgi:DegV family protein with EDD domain